MNDYYDKLETRTPQERDAELLAALREHIKAARANAPAYADWPDTPINSFEDFARLPLTRKSELRERQAAARPLGGFCPQRIADLRYLFASPGPLYEPAGDAPDYWRLARALYAAGFRKGDLVHNTFSYHLTPAGQMADSACQSLGCCVIPAGTGNTELQVQVIRDLQPTAYVGTPSFLKILIEHAEQDGGAPLSVQKALVSGEALPPPLRTWFAERDIQVRQCYATADVGLIAYETEMDQGLLIDESVYLEIVRPGTGHVLPPGEVGEVVATALNPVYPLLRFATGDLSAMLEGISPCGRTAPRIRGWLGRADQAAKVRGMFIRPEQIAELMEKNPQIAKARLVIRWLEQKDEMTLYAETENPSDALAEQLERSLRAVCKLRGLIELVEYGKLPNDGIVIEDARDYQAE